MKSSSITYQILAFTMACLMFMTSVGFTINVHYCKGQLKTYNLLGKAKSCHEMGEGMKNCPLHSKMAKAEEVNGNVISPKSCCSNKTFHIQSDKNQPNQLDNAVPINSQWQYFVIAFVENFLQPSATSLENPAYTFYTPPLISRDISVLHQSFLL